MNVQYQMTRPVKRQSLKVHAILFMTTMGIGNVFYARYCNSHFASKYAA